MRSEEWWKGRTVYKAPQYPIFIFSMEYKCYVSRETNSDDFL